MENFFTGLAIGFITGFVLMGFLIGDNGIGEFKKEAFEKGYMEKKINDKDQVIYVWK